MNDLNELLFPLGASLSGSSSTPGQAFLDEAHRHDGRRDGGLCVLDIFGQFVGPFEERPLCGRPVVEELLKPRFPAGWALFAGRCAAFQSGL